MREFCPAEIKFIKETHWTPTVQTCDEWEKTPFKNFEEAEQAAHNAGFSLSDLFDDLTRDIDAIGLENEAVYLLYTFFTCAELEEMTDKQCCEWLKDFKYFFGYRKWSNSEAGQARRYAVEVHLGLAFLYKEDDGAIWYSEK